MPLPHPSFTARSAASAERETAAAPIELKAGVQLPEFRSTRLHVEVGDRPKRLPIDAELECSTLTSLRANSPRFWETTVRFPGLSARIGTVNARTPELCGSVRGPWFAESQCSDACCLAAAIRSLTRQRGRRQRPRRACISRTSRTTSPRTTTPATLRGTPTRTSKSKRPPRSRRQLEALDVQVLGAFGSASPGILQSGEIDGAALSAALGDEIPPGAAASGSGGLTVGTHRIGGLAPPRGEVVSFEPIFAGGDVANGDAVVERMRARFRLCYQAGLDTIPDLSGDVVLTSTIDDAGAAVGIAVASSPFADRAPEVVACLKAVLASGLFSPPTAPATLALDVSFAVAP